MAAKNELKSLSVYLPYEIVIDSITELGFSLSGNVTVIADPIITLFASEQTCKKIESDISKYLP